MRTTRGRMAVAAAVGVLAASGAAAAQAGRAEPVPPGWTMPGRAMMAGGYGPGACASPTAPAGTLTAAHRDMLRDLAERQKLGRDVQLAFADWYDAAVFDHGVMSRSRRLEQLRGLLDRYAVPDPTRQAVGRFTTPAVQAAYDRMVAAGRSGRSAAVAVSVAAERADLGLLRSAAAGVTAPDVREVYRHLQVTGRHSLLMTENWSVR